MCCLCANFILLSFISILFCIHCLRCRSLCRIQGSERHIFEAIVAQNTQKFVSLYVFKRIPVCFMLIYLMTCIYSRLSFFLNVHVYIIHSVKCRVRHSQVLQFLSVNVIFCNFHAPLFLCPFFCHVVQFQSIVTKSSAVAVVARHSVE